ncbi:MAG: NUDIX domain-containing protein [Clostridiales bacterium]|nr:NUDIX domain-containing protein [Clostridiales bacterium]
MEIWDGYFRDGTPANIDLVRDRPIPEGLYHLVCDVLVRHRDGDFLLMQRDYAKPNYGGKYEATAGGSALKGESELECAKRELLEETGLCAESLEEFGRYISKDTIYVSYLGTVDCDKASVTLQPGETISYKWISESAFKAFIHSGEMIPTQRVRFENYFKKCGYI